MVIKRAPATILKPGTRHNILPGVHSLAPLVVFISTLKCSILFPIHGSNLGIFKETLHFSDAQSETVKLLGNKKHR